MDTELNTDPIEDLRSPYSETEWKAITTAIHKERTRREKANEQFSGLEQLEVAHDAICHMRPFACPSCGNEVWTWDHCVGEAARQAKRGREGR